MKYFIKKYIDRCNEEFIPLGFKRKKNSYLRIKNDILQLFYLKNMNGCLHTVEFHSIPLCCKINEYWADYGKYDMERFNIQRQYGAWFCSQSDESESNICVEQLIDNIKTFVIPFFDKTIDAESTFTESIALEKLFDENRKKYLQSIGKEDCAFLGPVDLYDRDKFYMALKIGNYEFAKASSELNLDCAIKAYEKSKDFITENNRIDRENDIKMLEKEICLLEKKEYDYFQELILENETSAKEILKKYL